MASVIGDGINIEYSIVDGVVTTLELFGVNYRLDGLNLSDYSDDQIDDELARISDRAKWNVNYGNGWKAFVIRLNKIGKIDLYELTKVS